jgi:cystathionine beta-lyase family protein involved in aluminum resistance
MKNAPKTVSNECAAQDLIRSAETRLKDRFEQIEQISYINQKRVLKAFRDNRLTEEHFAEHTGYGLDDPGRQVIDAITAQIMDAEAGAIRMQFVSGTHAIAAALFGNLLPGQRMACLTGTPYDTLHQVIGNKHHKHGSLSSLGIDYIEADIQPERINEKTTQAELRNILSPPTTIAHIQKSCGYSIERRTLSNREIKLLCDTAKKINPKLKIVVDNCYGEFVEENEPTACGADLIAGSMIKNPGGGLAISGGYLAGSKTLVDNALNRLTAPGIGGHQGGLFNQGRLILQGLFMAPTIVASAVKGAHLVAGVLEELGYFVKPSPLEPRYDIIQAVELKSEKALIAFCRAIQQSSPVNAHVAPQPALMPGYDDKVVMAGGTFIEGSTIELSADGPLRPPYVAYVQGGLTYGHIRYMIESVVEFLSGSKRSASEKIC